MEAALPTISRKSHKKSRLGCGNCKRRRIKCDEKHPTCANCAKHQFRCEYKNVTTATSTPLAAVVGPSPASSAGNNQDQSQLSPSTAASPRCPSGFPALNANDIYLWHHFMTSTSLTFNPTAASITFWHHSLPSLAFMHHYILHLLLALSALHLSRLSPPEKQFYYQLAEHHNSTALKSTTIELARLSGENCEPLYAAAILVCFYILAKGPQEGEYIAFNASGSDAQWLVLVRGVRMIIEHTGVETEYGALGALLRDNHGGRTVIPRSGPIPGFRPPLRNLREFLIEGKATEVFEGEFQCYVTTLDSLWCVYVSLYESQEGSQPDQYSNTIFGWLYRIEKEFTLRLREHRPFALIIFAYFAVLIKELDQQWFMEGWVEHILTGVRNFLGEEHSKWIEWPLEWAQKIGQEGIAESTIRG